ncbi:DedA family protein [Roseococcus sp. SYP-B2431]|uniref:DedA family protein n=1 Tax=Roseococcus sp. SYP-B2431 TaxID=2496640 RepID=UPI00103FD20B|nr:DedA family protein [Roseococcus sp. SYP-B2431]TCH98945.1 DedA family protein [Roseococcus sp. SYP-B2431]
MMDLVTSWVAAAGYVGVFGLMFLENLFPPIPSELIMPFAGFAAARGQLSVTLVILAGIAGTIVGNMFWYEFARAFGVTRTRGLCEKYGRWIGVNAADLDKAEETLRRWGPLAVFLGRIMPGIRTVISIPAGLIEMPRRTFYAWTTAGTAIWVGALTMVGYILEEGYNQLEPWIDPIGKGLILLVGVLFLWQLWRIWRRKKEG